jgi:hypothetical protein
MVELYQQMATGLKVNAFSQLPSRMQSCAIRYLVVSRSYPYLTVGYFEVKDPGGFGLNNTNKIMQKLNLPHSADGVILTFLRSFSLRSSSQNDLIFMSNATSVGPGTIGFALSANITNNITVYVIAYDILTYDKQGCLRVNRYSFISTTVDHASKWSYTNQKIASFSGQLEESSTFFGVSGHSFRNNYGKSMHF